MDALLSFAAVASVAVLILRGAPPAPAPAAAATPLLHLVALRFKAHLSDAEIVRHFEEEVNLKARMPALVASWSFSKNRSLEERRDVNGGCGWVVMCNLYDAASLPAYLVHPQHVEVGAFQNPLLDGKFVVDVAGAGYTPAQLRDK
jgi:hypothetical protein